jgi:hypothetical protein
LSWVSFLDPSVYLIYSVCSALSAENDRLKATVIKIADKVNAQGETSELRLDDVDDHIDQAVTMAWP